MLFVTEEFLIFFIFVYLLYWNVNKDFRFSILLISSLVFYATWSIPFIFHLIIFIGINYYGMELWKIYKKNYIFIFIIIIDVLNIGVFKYFYLFFDFLGKIFQISDWQMPVLKENLSENGIEIFLPLGISFYTFQIMSYAIDVYKGKLNTYYSFKNVLLYILFFPQLIAGPIMRAEELLNPIQKIRGFSFPEPHQVKKALWLLISGTLKKLIIADGLSNIIFPFYQSPVENLNSLEIWIFVFTSLVMLYSDFSAYSDIARGTGLLLGFEIPINFKAPFFMKSVSDFWRRWHLTFSMWIRDYIYIPLGGSRVPEWRNYINLIITFFLGGLWHGASYNFIIWGTLMGFILSIESFLFKRGYQEWPEPLLKKILRIIITWYVFLISALFFFIRDFERAKGLLFKMIIFDFNFQLPDSFTIIFFSSLIVFLFNYVEENPEKLKKYQKYETLFLIMSFIILIISLIELSIGAKDFFYFQF